MRSISSAEKPSASRRSRERPSTSFCAHGQAVIPWARTPISRRGAAAAATPGPRRRGDRGAEQGVDLLGKDAGFGRRLMLRVARLDPDLRALGALPVADLL